MKKTSKYIRSIKAPAGAMQFKKDAGLCQACGADTTFTKLDVITNDLAKQWNINPDLQTRYSIRESMHCAHCRCSARLRALAKALTLIFDPRSPSLKHSIERDVFKDKKVAEINACGDLHATLRDIPNLAYSEYEPEDKSIPHEDLQALSYKDNHFDLVLNSDTLEHVPDYKLALQEIHRVLKPGGYHVFTIPLIFSRKTRRRIHMPGYESVEPLEASYHGSGEPSNLVATEFGIDFLHELQEAGFRTKVYFANPFNKNEVNQVFVSQK